MKRIIIIALFFLYSLSFISTVQSAIYKFVDEQGVIHFTDVVPSGVDYEVVRPDRSSLNKDNSLADSLSSYINRICRKYSVDPGLVKKIIKVESGWNPYAVSKKGALGLMQLMPETLKQFGVINPFDPYENIKAGVRYLRYLIDRFEGDLRLALAAYNAGPTTVDRYSGVPPYNETKQYIKTILYKYNKKPISNSKKRTQKIYRIYLDDGTVMFTNTSVYLRDLSSF